VAIANACDEDRDPYRKKNDESFCHVTMPYGRSRGRQNGRDF